MAIKYNIYIFYILLFISIVLYFLYYPKPLEKFDNKYANYHIVCSKYNKNVHFLNRININSTIIEKGTNVPNKAHEATSYLHYIIENYDKLPENIIFIHDEDESWHHKGKISEQVYNWINNYIDLGKTYYEFNSEPIEKDFNVYNNNRVYRDFWEKFIEPITGEYSEALPENGKCCAQFIISRNKILKHPKNYYKNMYNWLIANTNGEGNGDKEDFHSGYMTSRYAEWSWRFIFS